MPVQFKHEHYINNDPTFFLYLTLFERYILIGALQIWINTY